MSDIHRIETQDGWKDIDTIQENDRVAIYLNNKFTENYLISPTFSTDGETHSDYVIPKFIDEKLGRLLGYLVSEGNISSRSTISITSTEIEIINDYCKLFNECFGVTPQIYKKNAFTDKRGWKCKESYEAKICRLGIRNYLEAIGLKRQKAQNKEIPSSILKSPKSVVSEFLSGLFEGDGTVVKYKDARRGREQCYVAYYSVSEKLCRQLQTILLKFNLIGGIAVRKGSLSENNQYFLRFANRWASSFCQQISFVTQRKRQIANDCSQMFPIEKPVVKFIKVKSIKKAIRQDVLYDFCIPDGHAFIGNGFKNHNTDIICDEYASIPEEIFQVVVRGFAAVSADPIEAAKIIAIEDEKIRRGEMTEADRRRIIGNKIIYSGTASYRFNHFWKLYSIHKLIIDNKFVGDAKEISGAFKEDDGINLEGNLDYRDYAIIQVPYTAIPRGFMDEKQINQAYATMPKALFSMEYECMFPNDSDGFFKRSAINAATPGLEDDGTAFGVELSGDPNYEYVMGIDPARKTDNLAISIVKLMKDGTYRNVYCESMRNKNWVEAMYRIRALLKKFNIVRIAVDQGGGGTTIEDLLQRPELAQGGEPLIWRYNDVEHRRYEGLHILDMVNFTPTWIAEANYGMAADIEHKKLLFPYRNLEVDVDETTDPVWDEMEEQINEMCMITVTATKTGIQHFDLPEIQTESSINLVQRKDRYSALLLASYAARTYMIEGISSFSPEPGFWADYL